MKRSLMAAAISCALATLIAPDISHAQDDAGVRSSRGLEQVIVQARRVEENVQDVPLAITAMSGEQLEKSGVAQFSDLVQRAPAIQFQQATGRRDAAIFGIRGQKADDLLLTSDQAVAVIISGVPVNWAYGTGISGALDISAVEVAKGPQGTLFGKNSTGGAIIITPAEPNNSTEGMVKAGVGNYNLRQLEGMFNTPLTDTLALRVAASATKQDGLEKNLDGGEDFNSTDNWVGRISLKWQPTDQLSSLLVVEGMYSSSSGPVGKMLALRPTAGTFAIYNPAFQAALRDDDFWEGHSDATHNGGYNDTKTWGVLNTTTFDVSDSITIKNIVGVRDLWYEGDADLDGLNRRDLAFAPIQFTSPQFTDAQSVTEELQIIGSYDSVDWIAGLYYAHTDGHDGSNSIQFNATGNAQITGPAGGVTNQTIAAFGQSTWHLTDRLNLTTGLRFTKDDRKVTYVSQTIPNATQPYSCLLRVSVAGNANATPTPCELDREEGFHEPTWNLSVDYKLTDNSLIYAATRHGYRSGGFPGRGQTTETTQAFDAETVNDYELGYKIDTDLAGMPLRVNTAVFYQKYKDIQRNITLNDGATLQNTVRNAASGTIQGGEVEFTFIPVDSLELSGFFSYIDAAYDKWTDQNSSAVCQPTNPTRPAFCDIPVDRSKNTFSGIPEKSGSLTARYTLPIPESVGDLSVSANVYWQDKTSLYTDNAVDSTGAECQGSSQGSYKIYNARIDWDRFLGVDGVSLAAWGKNLGNEEYFTSGLCLYNTAGIAMGYPGDPRTYGVTAQYKF